jgi:RNA:NAD 2'-phosphotransferase (TPT1/KptA family)
MNVRDLFSHTSFKSYRSASLLITVVLFNEKSRYELSFPNYTHVKNTLSGTEQVMPEIFIRATQGHSGAAIDHTKLMKEYVFTAENIASRERSLYRDQPPQHVFHGTKFSTWSGIKVNGLLPGGLNATRDAVHFATCLPTTPNEVAGGFRIDSELCICVNLHKWIRAGRKAYLSKNGVVCIFETVSPEYIMWCVDRQGLDHHHVHSTVPHWLSSRFRSLFVAPEKRLPVTSSSINYELTPVPGAADVDVRATTVILQSAEDVRRKTQSSTQGRGHASSRVSGQASSSSAVVPYPNCENRSNMDIHLPPQHS